MSGRLYTIPFGNVSIAATQDWFEVMPADDKPVELVAITFDQVGVADVGDAAEEMLRWQVVRGNATSGSGGSAVTPQPVKRGTAAAGFTAEVNNTTQASAGTAVVLEEHAFNVRAGERFRWDEEIAPSASQADGSICIRLPTAPADAITISGTLTVRELG